MKTPSSDVTASIHEALEFHRKGNLREAEIRYREILKYTPDHPDALHFLGLIAHQVGDHKSAAQLMEYSIQVLPTQANYYNNLGPVYRALGELDRSIECYQKAISLAPNYKEAHSNLGNALRDAGRLEEARAALSRAIEIDPNYAEAINNLGTIELRQQNFQRADELFTRAEQLGLRAAELFNNRGLVLRHLGKIDDAMSYWRKAIHAKPEFADAHNNLGLAYGSLGRLFDAVQCHERAIRLNPKSYEGHFGLGSAYAEQGRIEQALEMWDKAAELRPESGEPWNSRGVALQKLGKLQESIEAFKKALEVKPDYAEAMSNLGNAYSSIGALNEAKEMFEKALALRSDFAEAYCNLASICGKLNEFDRAIELSKRAIELRKDLPEAYQNLAAAQSSKNDLDEALENCREAIRLRPDYAEAYGTLGQVHMRRGENPEALAAIERSVALNPKYAGGHALLGTLYSRKGSLLEAVSSFKEALRLDPYIIVATNNLANVYVEMGKIDEALEVYLKGLDSPYDMSERHSNYIFTLLYSPKYSAERVFFEHRRWAEKYEDPLLPQHAPHLNVRQENRKLRVAYVSPDYREHAVTFFSEAILEFHDRDRFEVFCYSDVNTPDGVTKRLQGYGHTWRDLRGKSHAEVAEMVRTDNIDILVDLAGHTGGTKLLTFARRPAPIQVTCIGYPYSTGMRTIDYTIVDRHTDPVGMTERINSETPYRMPDIFWCFRPPDYGPDVVLPPHENRGYITFGCYNNYAKITDEAIEIWCRILNGVPNSRFALKARGLGNSETAAAAKERFARHGIAEDRLVLYGWTNLAGFMHQMNEVDIAVDSFPFNGGTTTCQTLWQGVPVVALAGNSRVSRMGVSILTTVGLQDLVAANFDDYVKIASNLTKDATRLRELRLTMRDRLRASPLLDGPRWTRNLENAYREMWRTWLAKG